ncbi:hypothetical protein [Sphingomonas sp. RIT328]|uniref:hypothetical protein n=1 Tax=Sphingomonas sp. RIT328 TaxID=1470591 RepID=UPI000447CFCB|nr:hypothetical protein [Sphingomonas sp. RIT328]EZP57442.1 hypothetical protein BW41_00287 [Sphingomonas sp. RIT328]
MEGRTISEQPPVEGPVLPTGALTFCDVEDRLVEALLTCWRYPDRERGWQRIRSAWPEISREEHRGDYDARGGEGSSSDVVLRPASQTRIEVAEMEEAFGWLDAISPEDRKLVGLAIGQLARGRREVSWLDMLARMGLKRGADGLRMRYGRAINAICVAQNGGNAGRNLSIP